MASKLNHGCKALPTCTSEIVAGFFEGTLAFDGEEDVSIAPPARHSDPVFALSPRYARAQIQYPSENNCHGPLIARSYFVHSEFVNSLIRQF
jgi:hypothetical protein